MLHRFGNAEVHQPDPHSRRKKHRNPREKRIFGFDVVPAQPDVSIAAGHNIHQKNNKKGDGPDIDPVEIDEYEIFNNV